MAELWRLKARKLEKDEEDNHLATHKPLKWLSRKLIDYNTIAKEIIRLA